MTSAEDGNADLGLGLRPGAAHYRAFVGPPEDYDLIAAIQFNLLTALGLREHHHLLDIGCGSLRAGRLFIPYLLPRRYVGVEPETWLIEEALEREIGRDVLEIKQPMFSDMSDFGFSRLGRRFDFLLAQSIFSHAPASMIQRCFEEAHEVMDPASVFVATFVEGRSNHAGDRWAYRAESLSWTDDWEQRGSVAYTFAFLRDLAARCRLDCRRLDWPHPRQRWIALSVRGAPPPRLELTPRRRSRLLPQSSSRR
jgi:SAM-dependent methyltransferase